MIPSFVANSSAHISTVSLHRIQTYRTRDCRYMDVDDLSPSPLRLTRFAVRYLVRSSTSMVPSLTVIVRSSDLGSDKTERASRCTIGSIGATFLWYYFSIFRIIARRCSALSLHVALCSSLVVFRASGCGSNHRLPVPVHLLFPLLP